MEDGVLDQVSASIPLLGVEQWQQPYAEIGNGATAVATVFDA